MKELTRVCLICLFEVSKDYEMSLLTAVALVLPTHKQPSPKHKKLLIAAARVN